MEDSQCQTRSAWLADTRTIISGAPPLLSGVTDRYRHIGPLMSVFTANESRGCKTNVVDWQAAINEKRRS